MGRLSLVGLSLCIASVASAEPAPIIGGTTTTVGEYPTVVALRIGAGICTGTLIHRDWVLTAAHCITPQLVQLPSQDAVTQSVRVHFGTVDLQASQGEVRTASMTIPKPSFSPSGVGSNDIGLIKLSQPITNIAPTPVNLDPARAPVGTTVTMVGYGITSASGGMAGVQFDLESRSSTSCTPYGLSDANLLCFSQTDNKGKCRGDSGGPSFAQIDGRAVVVGVTSFGDQQCAQLGADTRTDVERQFLETHIPNLAGCEVDDDCPGDKLCFDNRCIAPPFGPGGLGTACTTGSECDSGICGEGPDGKRCTDACVVGAEGACPDGFACLGSTGAAGACWPEDEDTGCCDASGRAAPTMLFGIALVALTLRRRRPRR